MIGRFIAMVLMGLALWICYCLYHERNAWPWIVVYWSCVVIKYAVELMGW